jgi:hypothetical protein
MFGIQMRGPNETDIDIGMPWVGLCAPLVTTGQI